MTMIIFILVKPKFVNLVKPNIYKSHTHEFSPIIGESAAL